MTVQDLESQAPELTPLVKSVKLTLKKNRVDENTARVVVVLDISISMHELYSERKVHELVARAMALGLTFDSDQSIEVHCFGTHAHYVGEYTAATYKSCVDDVLARFRLENSTDYSQPLAALKNKYSTSDLPVYVMFVTDGETANQERVAREIRELSHKKIFLQFMGLGTWFLPEISSDKPSEETQKQPEKKKGWLAKIFGSNESTVSSTSVRSAPQSSGFRFLHELDEMDGRYIDNVNFFAVKDPSEVSSEDLFAYLMNEYPQWLKEAREKGIV